MPVAGIEVKHKEKENRSCLNWSSLNHGSHHVGGCCGPSTMSIVEYRGQHAGSPGLTHYYYLLIDQSVSSQSLQTAMPGILVWRSSCPSGPKMSRYQHQIGRNSVPSRAREAARQTWGSVLPHPQTLPIPTCENEMHPEGGVMGSRWSKLNRCSVGWHDDWMLPVVRCLEVSALLTKLSSRGRGSPSVDDQVQRLKRTTIEKTAVGMIYCTTSARSRSGGF